MAENVKKFDFYVLEAARWEKEGKHIPAFFLRRYVAEQISTLLQNNAELRSNTEILNYLKEQIEAASRLKQVDPIDDTLRKEKMLNFCKEQLDEAEKDVAGNRCSTLTVRKFHVTGMLFDTLANCLSPEDLEQRRYAKQKAVQLKRSMNATDSSHQAPVASTLKSVEQQPVSSSSSYRNEPATMVFNNEHQYSNPQDASERLASMIERNKVMEVARKKAQFAIGALDFGSVSEALQHLHEAIDILTSIK